MLSILIPIYNFESVDLVRQICNQCEISGITFEVIALDDCSGDYFKKINIQVKLIPQCIYEELNENIGRSKIRNLLVTKAKYQNLLFLDCDSEIMSANFIYNYKKYFNSDKVIYGGRNYQANPPKNYNLYLRWLYGVKRETIPVNKRKKHPYIYFLSNNFLVPKKYFEEIKFDETLVGYGHEDTLFSFRLKNKNIQIEHIDNPLCHVGLETNLDFLLKTEEGLKNLVIVNKKMPEYSNEIRIIKIVNFLTKINLAHSTRKAIKLFEKIITKNLLSTHPSLFLFDIFKLRIILDLENLK